MFFVFPVKNKNKWVTWILINNKFYLLKIWTMNYSKYINDMMFSYLTALFYRFSKFAIHQLIILMFYKILIKFFFIFYSQTIRIPVMDNESYEKDIFFYVELEEPIREEGEIEFNF